MSKSLGPERGARKRIATPEPKLAPKLARGTRDIAPAAIKVARGTREISPILELDSDDDTIVVDPERLVDELALDSDAHEVHDVAEVSEAGEVNENAERQASELAAATDARMIELGRRRFG